MARYFLKKLSVEGFRGINNEGAPLELEFDPAKVNSIYAVNGHGKSSLFEALSFAIRGSVLKLDEMQAQDNPSDYYANKFHSTQQATIALQFVDDTGQEGPIDVLVIREASGKRLVTSPSGHTDPEAFLHSLSEDFTLLDHKTFVKFMENSSLVRGRSFSSLLGLSNYSDARQSLQTAVETRSFNTDFDTKSSQEAIDSFGRQIQPTVATMLHCYEKITGTPIEDTSELENKAPDIVNALSKVSTIRDEFKDKKLADVDFETVKEVIKKEEGGERRQELATAVGAISKMEAISELSANLAQGEFDAILGLVAQRDKAIEGTRGDLFRKMFGAADALVKSDDWDDLQTCPLCDRPGLTNSIQEHIETCLGQYASADFLTAELTKVWKESAWVVRCSALETLLVEEAVRSVSKAAAKVPSGEITSTELNSLYERYQELEDLFVVKKGELEETKAEIEKELPASLVQLTEQVELARQYQEALQSYLALQKSRAQIQRQLDIRERWREFIAAAAKAYAKAETKLSKKTIFAIEGQYKDLFRSIMNVGDIVPDLQRLKDGERLHVNLSEFHGLADQSARALLSESYSNALAISIFLSAAVNHTGTPRFVVLDDVTSSFDSGHQFRLMEAIRTKLQHNATSSGLQFLVLSHEKLLQKYFDTLSGQGGWNHFSLEGSPPMGAILLQGQTAGQLKPRILDFLDAGQVERAYPHLRQYLEFKLQEIIRKLKIPVPIDFAIKDNMKMVSHSLNAINAAVDLHDQAGSLILDPQQVKDLKNVYVPALLGNWVSHYETGAAANFSVPMLRSVVQSIDDFADCFHFDDINGSSTQRRWYKSLAKRK